LRKIKIYGRVILLVIVSTIVFLIAKEYLLKQSNQLVYKYNNSYHNGYYFENDYVVFNDNIKIKNNSSKDLYFYISADVSKEKGLVVENTAIACKQNSLEKEKFFIKANSEQEYGVYFKCKKGIKDTKQDRLPPSKIKFEIVKMEAVFQFISKEERI